MATETPIAESHESHGGYGHLARLLAGLNGEEPPRRQGVFTMATFTGKCFDLCRPRVEDVCLEDIAHGLANQCRFCGQSKWHYSIAQHSVLVAQVVFCKSGNAEVARHGLLHDAQEAFILDVHQPLKALLGRVYANIEQDVESVIARALHLQPMSAETRRLIKEADRTVLLAEMEVLMPDSRSWANWAKDGNAGKADVVITQQTPEVAKRAFLDAYTNYTER